MPTLEALTWSLDEPFDNHMTLVRAVYLAAHRQGLKVLLDGVGGDVVLSEGTHLARLLRRGRWVTAWRETVGQNRFWGEGYSVPGELYRSARTAFAPAWARRLRRGLSRQRLLQRRAQRFVRESLISPDFARKVCLAERLQTMSGLPADGLLAPYGLERARSIDGAYLAAARERYDRVAAAVAVESRDPFLDLRVVALCLALPGEQKIGQGWPKIIQRRAMAGRLPDAVRWRRGKENLGWAFTAALMTRMKDRLRLDAETDAHLISPYVDAEALDRARRSYFEEGDQTEADKVYQAAHLVTWLYRCAGRPQAAGRPARQPAATIQ
jgi:asparagine synthase (glutamine-hydrolysing)